MTLLCRSESTVVNNVFIIKSKGKKSYDKIVKRQLSDIESLHESFSRSIRLSDSYKPRYLCKYMG